MPRFSIVIPTRQRADTLRFSIETALAQTHPDFEVVVQNNGNDRRPTMSSLRLLPRESCLMASRISCRCRRTLKRP